MAYQLSKYSEPGWDMDFATEADAVTELRKHICADCLAGSRGWLNEVVDQVVDGLLVECRDAATLLSTPCGCEYGIEELVTLPNPQATGR